jgi:hypothetical protein
VHLREKRFANLLVLLLSLVFCIGITEIGMRILLKSTLGTRTNEKSLLYRYDPTLGWFPVENSKKIFTGSRPIEVAHNSRGFRDPEHVVDTRPGILFLGDSFVWGYDVERDQRFTEKLRAKLPDWAIYNLGVSGYGTDQEYLLLEQQFDYYKPNIVFLVFCAQNDELDNSHNVRYGGYFKPYFIADGDSLTLRGVPVPKSDEYFLAQHTILSHSYWFRLLANGYFRVMGPRSLELRDPTRAIITHMHRFVKARGAEFIVGLQGANPELEKYLKDNNIPCLDLSNSYTYPTKGNHWTPEGHTLVSERIYNFLMQGGYLKEETAPHNARNTDAVSAKLPPGR